MLVFYKILVHNGPTKWPSSLLRLPIYIGLTSQNITTYIIKIYSDSISLHTHHIPADLTKSRT